HEAGHHVPLAGVGKERRGLRPLDGSRPEVHRQLVADAGPENSVEDRAGGVERERGEVDRESVDLPSPIARDGYPAIGGRSGHRVIGGSGHRGPRCTAPRLRIVLGTRDCEWAELDSPHSQMTRWSDGPMTRSEQIAG